MERSWRCCAAVALFALLLPVASAHTVSVNDRELARADIPGPAGQLEAEASVDSRDLPVVGDPIQASVDPGALYREPVSVSLAVPVSEIASVVRELGAAAFSGTASTVSGAGASRCGTWEEAVGQPCGSLSAEPLQGSTRASLQDWDLEVEVRPTDNGIDICEVEVKPLQCPKHVLYHGCNGPSNLYEDLKRGTGCFARVSLGFLRDVAMILLAAPLPEVSDHGEWDLLASGITRSAQVSAGVHPEALPVSRLGAAGPSLGLAPVSVRLDPVVVSVAVRPVADTARAAEDARSIVSVGVDAPGGPTGSLETAVVSGAGSSGSAADVTLGVAAPASPMARNTAALPSSPSAAWAGMHPVWLLVGLALLLPSWALYRRVRQARALDNVHRKAIHDRVLAEPGVTPSELQQLTGLHYTTCQHHLRILQELGFVEVQRIGGLLRCFENHRRYGTVEKRLAVAARTPTACAMLETILRKPGVTPAEVARAVGIARSSAKHHVDRLSAWGLVEVEPAKGRLRLRIHPRAIDPFLCARGR